LISTNLIVKDSDAFALSGLHDRKSLPSQVTIELPKMRNTLPYSLTWHLAENEPSHTFELRAEEKLLNDIANSYRSCASHTRAVHDAISAVLPALHAVFDPVFQDFYAQAQARAAQQKRSVFEAVADFCDAIERPEFRSNRTRLQSNDCQSPEDVLAVLLHPHTYKQVTKDKVAKEFCSILAALSHIEVVRNKVLRVSECKEAQHELKSALEEGQFPATDAPMSYWMRHALLDYYTNICQCVIVNKGSQEESALNKALSAIQDLQEVDLEDHQ
jgi:hypothetical protein